MNSIVMNLGQILKTKSTESWSGCLNVFEPQDRKFRWQIYFYRGQIIYARATPEEGRLKYLWQKFPKTWNLPELTNFTLDYSELCKWFDREGISLIYQKKIIEQLSKDVITQIVSIQTTSTTESSLNIIDEVLVGFSWKKLIEIEKIKSWKKVRTYISSPFSKMLVPNDKAFEFYRFWKKLAIKDSEFASFANSRKISEFVNYFLNPISLYELALIDGLDPLLLGQNLKPFIEENLILINNNKKSILPKNENVVSKNVSVRNKNLKSYIKKAPDNNNLASGKLIVCIDDSKTVQTQVKRILESVGYQVINITDATSALRILSRQNPTLILMDINMPDINGYDLCSMLKRSQKFQKIPIVMLTGRDGIIDRMRAKIVGSNNYLTKPFQPQQLIDMVREVAENVVPVRSSL